MLSVFALIFASTVFAADYSGLYRLKSRYNNYVQENATNHRLTGVSQLVANDYKQLWIVEKVSSHYTIRNVNSGRYIPDATDVSSNSAITTADASSFIYIKESEGNSQYLTISWKNDFSGTNCLHENSVHNIVKWNANKGEDENPYSDWTLEPVSDSDTFTKKDIQMHLGEVCGIVTDITDGYYRFVPVSAPEYSMSEDLTNNSVVTTMTNVDNFAQIWQITNKDGKIVIKNAISQAYLPNNSLINLSIKTTTSEDNIEYTYDLANTNEWEPSINFTGKKYGFSRNASNKVVGANNTTTASQWRLYRVEVDQDRLATEREALLDLSEIKKNPTEYNAKLQKYFSDNACTILRDEYAAMTESDLRAAMAADGMPGSLQNMAVCVLTDKWDADATRSKYVKLFRIQDIEIASNNNTWKSITDVGPWAELINPTGITGKLGDVIFIYADDAAKDADAELIAQLSDDTKTRSQANLTLKKGLNIWTLPGNGEVFIGYTLKNSKRYLREYPNIRIHIERGTVNGYWDMSRGMTNADWTWLKNNMFANDFLHIKGKSTILNTLRARVVGASNPTDIMKAWDFAFEKLEYLIGNDGQWEGRYRPFLNPRHSYSGNPNWSGYGGSNHPEISSNYLFNYNNFYEGNIWEILHEVGHGHQYPINAAGTTEISNNSLAQMVSFLMGRCYSRGDGVQKLVQMFNYEVDGKRNWSWADYARYATPYYDASLHVANQMLYKLFIYFEVLGHSPGFMPRLCDELRKKKIIKGSSIANPTYYYNDYWRLAEACAKVTQTDLWEFFEAHGFWKYYDEVLSTNDNDNDPAAIAAGIRFLGDYGNYYLKMPVRGDAADEKRMADMKEFMHSMPNKASNVMFLDDRINNGYVKSGSFVAQVNRSLIGKPLLTYWGLPTQGDFGHYTFFDGKNRSRNLSYTIGNTIETQRMNTSKGGDWDYDISGYMLTVNGSGILGVKIYDENDKLCYLGNTRSFIIPVEMAENLKNGTYKLHIAITAGWDEILDENGKPTGVESIVDDNDTSGDDTNQPIRDLQGRIVTQTQPGQIYIQGKKKFIAQ